MPPITEEKLIRKCVNTPRMIQIGFCKAAEQGYNRALRIQLARGANKNGTNHQHDTAILLAAACGRTDTVRVLLKWGVKFDEFSTETWDFGTPLHVAAVRGHANVVDLLLKAGAKSHVYDNNELIIRGIPLPSVWEAAVDHPAVLKVLKAHRARKNWAKVRSLPNMKKIKVLSIYWFWLEQTARSFMTPDPQGIAFMQVE